MIDKILKIQNKSKSLMWGCAQDEKETMFAVGHKSYPKQTKYFVVTNDFVIGIVTDDHKIRSYTTCSSEEEVLKVIYDLLKQWFPAKGVSPDGNVEKVSEE